MAYPPPILLFDQHLHRFLASMPVKLLISYPDLDKDSQHLGMGNNSVKIAGKSLTNRPSRPVVCLYLSALMASLTSVCKSNFYPPGSCLFLCKQAL